VHQVGLFTRIIKIHIFHNCVCNAGTSPVGPVVGVGDAKAPAMSLWRVWIGKAKFHCCIQKKPPLRPNRTHFNSVHAISFRFTLILSSYLRPGLWSHSSTSQFPVNNYIYIYLCVCVCITNSHILHVTIHYTLVDLLISITFAERFILCKLSSC
jgi:hypothetical protein